MQIGPALVLASKFAKEGAIYAVGDGTRAYVIARRAPCTLVVNCPEVPFGALALDAESVWAGRSTLEALEGEIACAPFEGGARFLTAEGHVDVATLARENVPAPPDLRSVTWEHWTNASALLAQRIAGLAAVEKDDRPGLTWAQLGPRTISATDEAVVAVAHGGLSFQARMPAWALPFAAPGNGWSVGDLGGGSIAIRSCADDAVIVLDAGVSTGLWFPDLLRVMAAGEPAPLASLVRSEVAACVRAAAAASEHDVVAVTFRLHTVEFGGGAAHRMVCDPAYDPQVTGTVLVRAPALIDALAKGSKKVGLGFRGSNKPIDVSDGDFHALVFPVVRG